jgi:hypothetical protein
MVFEPTIPAFEQAKTVHALGRADTVKGMLPYQNLFGDVILPEFIVDIRPVLELLFASCGGSITDFCRCLMSEDGGRMYLRNVGNSSHFHTV